MPISDTLDQFRKGGYGEKQDKKSESSGPRMFKLTDDEAKAVQEYSKGEGMETECTVTGRLGENGEFTVTSVRTPGGDGADQDQMASEVMAKMGQAPMMRPQTMPSPS